MELKFKHFTVTNDNNRQFIVNYNNAKHKQNYYYGNFESLVKGLLTRYCLKSEAKDLKTLVNEIREFRKEVKKLSSELKNWKINFDEEINKHR